MEIKQITLKELKPFTESLLYIQGETIPITGLRVESQMNNPFARPDDVVLTVMYHQHELMGYIGALPSETEGLHFAWNSCWWVKDGAPATVSMNLLYSFLSNWDKKVAFSELTPFTLQIIERMGFCKHETLWGIRCFYRFNLAFYLPRKFSFMSWSTPILKVLDSAMNVFLNQLISIRGYALKQSFNVVEMQIPDEATMAFIQAKAGVTDRKSLEVFRWIEHYKWLTTEGDKSEGSRYYFSFHVQRFETVWVKLLSGDGIVGVAMLSIRDNELKVPYVFVNPDEALDLALYIRKFLSQNTHLHSVTVFHPGVVAHLQNNVRGFLHRRRIPKYTAVSQSLLNELQVEYPDFQMGDGDVVFT